MQKPDPNGPSDSITLFTLTSTLTLSLFGAHITSFTVQNQERLWMSSLAVLDGSKPIRGGVPIAFPQFADEGNMKLHGFAREAMWRVESLEDSKVVLKLNAEEESKAIWGNDFELTYTVELLVDSLDLNLSVKNTNTNDKPFSFTGCLHSYFLFDETANVELNGGLEGKRYIDKCDGRKEKVQEGLGIVIPVEAKKSGEEGGREGYVDRIYLNTAGQCTFSRGGKQLYKVKQSESWPDTTLYNPWLGDKQGPMIGPDFDDDGYTKMICLEPTISKGNAVTLEVGETWEGWQRIQVEKEF
ncbi:hypothetical protein TL16_g13207 [Triparma laevis f. inornata]|uniref:glucose-6-phosphate 1-epimerase n=2 Tax=Triparma laevis TaxID=1534972 RepID=A0A9W7F9Y2_9STRA|nr:hypothetical protein TL16_g13207 [Triparma laevis f. inornata]GMI06139.1 hypothetical protein TrLO_g2325 [Triparma laevis f. longispina]